MKYYNLMIPILYLIQTYEHRVLEYTKPILIIHMLKYE